MDETSSNKRRESVISGVCVWGGGGDKALGPKKAYYTVQSRTHREKEVCGGGKTLTGHGTAEECDGLRLGPRLPTGSHVVPPGRTAQRPLEW